MKWAPILMTPIFAVALAANAAAQDINALKPSSGANEAQKPAAEFNEQSAADKKSTGNISGTAGNDRAAGSDVNRDPNAIIKEIVAEMIAEKKANEQSAATAKPAAAEKSVSQKTANEQNNAATDKAETTGKAKPTESWTGGCKPGNNASECDRQGNPEKVDVQETRPEKPAGK